MSSKYFLSKFTLKIFDNQMQNSIMINKNLFLILCFMPYYKHNKNIFLDALSHKGAGKPFILNQNHQKPVISNIGLLSTQDCKMEDYGQQSEEKRQAPEELEIEENDVLIQDQPNQMASLSSLMEEETFSFKSFPGSPNSNPNYDISPQLLSNKNLTQLMRAKIRDFLLEECYKQKMFRSTYGRAVTYLDIFLMKSKSFSKLQLQELAIGCLIIAAKIEESRVPAIKFEVFKKQTLLQMEKRVITKLNFFLNPPIYIKFAQYLVMKWDQFASGNNSFGSPMMVKTQQANLRLRSFYERLDSIYQTLKSLLFSQKVLISDLFYLETRIQSGVVTAAVLLQNPKELIKAYDHNDLFYQHYQEFLHQKNIDVQAPKISVGQFIQPFLKFEVSPNGYCCKKFASIRMYDQIQTATKGSYDKVSSVIKSMDYKNYRQ